MTLNEYGFRQTMARSSTIIALAVQASACGGSPTAPDRPAASDEVVLGTVRHRATSELVTLAGGAPAVRLTLTLWNEGSVPVEVRYGGCFTRVLAYRLEDRSDPAAWDSFEREEACLLQVFSQTLEAGGTGEIRTALLVSKILGRAVPADRVPLSTARAWGWLPNGRYYLVLVASTTLGTVALNAGDLWLAD